ncbi:MAG TPA: SAM-dependent methyltransferase, partial [Promineifilum sp.]|nr:SAM-dependent methyltransferase [Promineifilum sp.]
MTDLTHSLRERIHDFQFRPMFINELGWDNFQDELAVPIDGATYRLRGVAHKRGLVVYLLETAEMPDGPLRNKIETQVARSRREHILIFADEAHTRQVWLWALREIGRPLARRSFDYHAGQSGEALAQRLDALAFSLAEEDDVTLVEVAGRVRAAFNVERATKKFYDGFSKERDAFGEFIDGIPDADMSKWYVSVMLNRLMFIYFIQKKGFLDGDTDYLRNRLRAMRATYGEDRFDRFYRYFLLRLFHDGLGKPNHDPGLQALIGRVPYLNGGIFQIHEVEKRYPDIRIPDEAFERVFDFFDRYRWHLDDRPLRDDREINPDVLGYIFEKYINQKQMGAYYTREDITEYISKNTIIPFLFDRARADCKVAFEGRAGVW